MKNIRQPQQKRSIQTRAKIMTAAFELFAHKGIHGTNSKEIVKKANVSVGSFYSYFKNKKTLLLEMLEDYLERHFTAIWGKLDDYNIDTLERDDVKAIFQNVFQAYDISPEFHRQTHALRYSDPDIHRVYDQERNREIEIIRFLLEKNRSRLNVEDTFATAIVIHNAVENVAHTAKFIGPAVDEERLIDALTNMIYRFVMP